MPMPTLSWLIERFYISQPRLRERITRAVYGDADREVSLFNMPVRINTLRENGYFRAARLSRRSSLLRDEILVFNRLPCFFEPNMTFLDIGANIGIFSIMMASFRKLIPGFGVTAFEVHPATFARLQQNAEKYGFTAHNVGLSSTATTRSFVEGAVSHVTCMSEDSNRYIIAGRGFEARCERLDSFEFPGRLAMKIDVEGHEYDVLEGAEALFAEGRVKVVYVDGYGDDTRVPEFLTRHGFSLYDCLTLEPATEKVFNLLAVRDQGAASSPRA